MDQSKNKDKAMSGGSNRILDELAKLATDAAGAAQGVRAEAETAFRAQIERVLNKLDLVQREDFEAVKEMASKARNENEALKKRVDALEQQLSDNGKTAAKTSVKPSKEK